MDSFVPFGGFFPSHSDLKGPLNGSFFCVPHCHRCVENCEHEVLAASKERFSVPAADPYPSTLPQWLKTAEIGTVKALNVKGDDVLAGEWKDAAGRKLGWLSSFS